jgi:hypothetical protein
MDAEANEDFVDMVRCLGAEGCEFLVVGAYAVAAHGAPRATGDIDLLVRPSPDNAARVYRALLRFGAPVEQHGVTAHDFEIAGMVYQIGLPPRRIDLLTEISGVSFEEAARETIVGSLGGVQVPCIGLDALIRNKRSAGRTKDLADAEVLEEIRARR